MNCLLLLASVANPTLAAEPVWVVLGPENEAHGLTQVDQGDGTTVADEIGGRSCRRTDLSWPERPGYRRFIYLDVDDAYLKGGSSPVSITVEYFDGGRGSLRLDYDSPGADVGANFRPLVSPPGRRSGSWQSYTFLVPDAEFAGGANGRDFRLSASAGELHLARVEVRKLSGDEYASLAAEREREQAARSRDAEERASQAEAALLEGAGDHAKPFESVALFCGPLLAAQAGPWDGLGEPATEAYESWRRIIDYARRRGFTRVIAGGIRGSAWDGDRPDYIEVVDWARTDFPEAAVLSSDEVAHTLAEANRVLEYAHERGVPIWLHNYHFTAPAGLLKQHPKITARDEPKGDIATNVDWAVPLYQEWLETAWREEFRNLPHLAGRYDTMGEMVFGTQDVTRAAEEFTRLYVRVHRECGREPMMRNWWMHRCHRWIARDIERRVSPGIHYVMKFSHTDSVTRQPDAELRDWVAAGLTMSANVYYPGENARFFVWADPRFVFDTVRSSKQIGMRGMTLGRSGPSAGVGAINDRAFAAYASGELGVERFDRERWQRYVGRLLGTDGARALRAMELYGEAVRSMSRVVGEPCEGFDMQYTHVLPPRKWMSTLGYENANPPAEWREGICPYLEILQALQAPGATWREDLDAVVAGKRQSPMAFLRARAADAGQAAELLDSLEAQDAEQLGLLRDNAHAAAIYTAYWEKLLWARLRYEAVIQAVEGADLPQLADDCTAEFGECVAMLRQVADLLGTSGPRAELAIREAELAELKSQLDEATAVYRQGGWRVEAEKLDVSEDGAEAGYYVDLNPDLIRLGPPGVYPFRPHYEGFVRYPFTREAGEYEVTLQYLDDRDDPPDTDAHLSLSLGDDEVLAFDLNANDDKLHARTVKLRLKPGDVLTIRGRTDRTGNDFCRIDRLVFLPVK